MNQNKMDNLSSRINRKLGNNEKDYLKCTPKAVYILHKIDKNLVRICKWKLSLKLNKPAYIGMCILELSKVSMCEFFYYYIKKKCDNKSKLLLTLIV